MSAINSNDTPPDTEPPPLKVRRETKRTRNVKLNSWNNWHKPVVGLMGGVIIIGSLHVLLREIPSLRSDFCNAVPSFWPSALEPLPKVPSTTSSPSSPNTQTPPAHDPVPSRSLPEVRTAAVDGNAVEIASGGTSNGRSPYCQRRAVVSCVLPQRGGQLVVGSANAVKTYSNGRSGVEVTVNTPDKMCAEFWASTTACETEVRIRGYITATEKYSSQ